MALIRLEGVSVRRTRGEMAIRAAIGQAFGADRLAERLHGTMVREAWHKYSALTIMGTIDKAGLGGSSRESERIASTSFLVER